MDTVQAHDTVDDLATRYLAPSSSDASRQKTPPPRPPRVLTLCRPHKRPRCFSFGGGRCNAAVGSLLCNLCPDHPPSIPMFAPLSRHLLPPDLAFVYRFVRPPPSSAVHGTLGTPSHHPPKPPAEPQCLLYQSHIPLTLPLIHPRPSFPRRSPPPPFTLRSRGQPHYALKVPTGPHVSKETGRLGDME